MPLLDAVAQYVEDQTGFTIGSSSGTLSKAVMLDSQPDTLIGFYETGGAAPAHTFSTSTALTNVAFERPNLQVISRSTSYATARANIETVYTTLDGVHDATLTGTRYLSISAIQAPFDIGDDGNGRHRVSVNFTVWKEVG